MRWLIDGYNLMHASGAAGDPRTTAEAFRRRRRRFLSDLAEGLGSARAAETTVVFDAATPPPDFDLESSYEGIHVIFALGDENADARIEQLIAAHSAPKSLTVVSSDRRVRRAASRRKARALTSDEFLDLLDRLRTRGDRDRDSAKVGPTGAVGEPEGPSSPQEREFWIAAFGDLERAPETREAFAPEAALLTDVEIALIQREIDREH